MINFTLAAILGLGPLLFGMVLFFMAIATLKIAIRRFVRQLFNRRPKS